MGTDLRSLALRLACWLALTAPNLATANAGSDWLASQAQTDGSYLSATPISTNVQATSEALLAFSALAETRSTSAAVQFLAADTNRNSEDLARRIGVGAASSQDVSALVTELITHQDAKTGGFGEFQGYAPDVLDTALALEAIAVSGNSSGNAAGQAVGFLQQQQGSDGSWVDSGNASSIYVTALSTASLNNYKNIYSLSAAIQNASNYLLSQRGGDNLWGEDFLSAESLIALLRAASDLGPIQASVSALSARQLSDGSWDDDVFSTALSLRAIALAGMRTTVPSSGNGAVDGYVTRAGSNQPIVGATISIPAISGLSVQTNSGGYFILSGLSKGNVTVVASQSGFGSASTVVTVVQGQTSAVSGLVLAQLSQSGELSVKVVDAVSGSPIVGAGIGLSGPASYNVTSGGGGAASVDGITPGNYSFTVQASGYATVQGNLSISGGQSALLAQALAKVAASGSATLAGTVVDAGGNPVSSATFNLGNGQSAISDSSGRFSINSVSQGSYSPTLSASGYVSRTLALALSSGGSINLGALPLYSTNNSAAANSVTLLGTVVDGVNNASIAGAIASIPGTSFSATSDANGQFVIAGIQTLSFSLSVSSPNYSARNYTITASGYGTVSGTFALPRPAPSGATTTSIAGHVSDSSTRAAIAGATVKVVGTSISAQTDSAGAYQLQNISSQQFKVQATAPNYSDATFDVSLGGAGAYTLDIPLDPSTSAQSGFQILSLSTNDAGKGANQVQLFTAQIANTQSFASEGIIVGHVLDSSGNEVTRVTPYAPGTQTTQGDVFFASQETKTLQIPWNSLQFPAGAYTLQLDVVKPGSIAQSLPGGTVLAERSAFTNVSLTSSFVGTLAFNPPLSQAGSSTPVTLDAFIVNSGNSAFTGQSLTVTISAPNQGSVLFSAQATVPPLPAGGFELVHFGQWSPTQYGNLGVRISANGSGLDGQISASYYVGDRPQGTFVVNPSEVFTGNQTVHGAINVTGVNGQVGVGDPLVFAIGNAIAKGFPYVATNERIEQQQDSCMRCHVQSQSYAGLASLIGHNLGSDPVATQYIYNSLATTQQGDGGVFNSLGQWGETQTDLALWALTYRPDKIGTYAVSYKAATYMSSRATVSGASVHWTPDYTDGGWWINPDSHTMMAVKGFVDLLLTAKSTDVTGFVDYAPSETIGGAYPTAGLKPASDGMLYEITQVGYLLKLNPTTGELTAPIRQLPVNCFGILPLSPTEFYIGCANTLYHIFPNGTRQTEYTLGDNGGDVVQSNDGTIYVSDTARNQILRGPVGGPFTVFSASSLLKSPMGLTFDPSGNLLVANYAGGNILRLSPDGRVSVAVEGLSFPPIFIVGAPDGTLYASHPGSLIRGTSTPGGLTYISAAGVARRLFSLNQTSGLTLLNGQLFMTNSSSGEVKRLVTKTLDTSGLPTLSAQVSGAVNYFLSEYNDGQADNIYQASRLIGLGEARRVVTDPSLLSQIDQAIDAIKTRLLSQQYQDGGFPRFYRSDTPSDPIVTALVGIALDYTSLPANDPSVVKAVKYLLNTQAADGSWASTIMGTKLAATSLVMIYLPREFDRVNGINVELHVNTPATTQIGSTNTPPSSTQATPDGGNAYTWSLPHLTSTGTTISFDLSLANLQFNESRPAASQAYLLSQNSFDNSQVRVDLAIPKVHASNGLTLGSVQTDKPEYSANDTAQLAAQINNVAPNSVSGSIRFTIAAAADHSVVKQFDPVAFSGLAPNQSTQVNVQWAVGNTVAGNYLVHADLYDSTGALSGSTDVAFTIGTGGGQVASLRTTTDRSLYNTSDQVSIDDLARNLTTNHPIDNARLIVRVLNSAGGQVFTQNADLGQMAPGATREVPTTFRYQASAEGTYNVQGELRDGNGNLVASGSTTYQISENRAVSLAGSVNAATATLNQGDSQSCTDTISNRGTLDDNGQQIRQLVTRLDQNALLASVDSTLNLASGASQTLSRSVDTGAMTGGDYACVLQAYVNNSWNALGYTSFHVNPEPVRVSETVRTDRNLYDTTDQTQIAAVVSSLMRYRTVTGATERLMVLDATGATTYSQDIALGDLAPGAQVSAQSTFAYTRIAQGAYTARGVVLDAGGQLLASQDARFTVQDNLDRTITGAVSAQYASVQQGATQNCTDTLSNSGVADASLQVRESLSNLDSAQTVSSTEISTSVPASGVQTLAQPIAIGGLAPGNYACVLAANINGQWKNLGSGAFHVTQEPAKVSDAVSTDKATYDTTDQVQIADTVSNQAQFRTVSGATLNVTITSPSGTTAFTQSVALADLAAGASVQKALTFSYSQLAEGTYSLTSTVSDSSGQTLVTASAGYQVIENLSRTITGSVAATAASVTQGATESCADTISNSGVRNDTGLPIRQSLNRTDQPQAISSTTTTIDLAAGATQTLNRNIATGPLNPGSYACALEASVNNVWKNLGSAAFQVTQEPSHLSDTFTTDRPSYDTSDTVQLDSVIGNLAQYRTEKGDALHVQVTSPSGQIVFSRDIALADLAPGASVDKLFTYTYTQAVEGVYAAKSVVLDASGAILISTDTQYTVKASPANAITGSVTATPSSVQQGSTETCVSTLNNSSSYAISGLQIRQSVIRTDQAQSISAQVSTVDVQAKGSQSNTNAFTTGSLASGTYSCTLEASINNAWKALGSAAFTVTPAPPKVKVDGTLSIGDKGRLLVLMDNPTAPPYSTNAEPSYTQQRAFLETLLKANGFSYSIVTDKDAFARELRKGDYSAYALFAETIKLDDQVQGELREAIFRGEGLLSADQHDMRENKLEDSLGLKYVGKHPSTTGLQLFANDLGITGFTGLTLPGKALKAQLTGATKGGSFQGVGTTDDSALTTYRYGNGTAVYTGFDLLAEATVSGNTSLYASLLIKSLVYLQPSYATTYAGQTVPLTLTLTNRGNATPGRALITLPSGMTISDNGGATTDSSGRLVWSFNLAQSEQKTFTAWVRTPSTAGSASISAQIQTGTSPNYTDQTPASVSVSLNSRPGLQDARTLAGSDKDYKTVQLWLEKTNADLTASQYANALGDLVRAADEVVKTSKPTTRTLRLEIDQAILDVSRKL